MYARESWAVGNSIENVLMPRLVNSNKEFVLTGSINILYITLFKIDNIQTQIWPSG